MASESKYNPTSVQDAWDNHFSAFGGQDVDKIMLDYDENSVVRVSTVKPEAEVATATYDTLEKIKAFFEGAFKALTKPDKITAPVVEVEESPGMVFLVWKAPEDGFISCNDTFVFTKEFKIKWQNVVLNVG